MTVPGTPAKVLQDRYELLEPIGRGGMGVVWKAHDTLLQRRVAVKEVMLPAGLPDDEVAALRARVLREARAAGRLNHPNVTTIYDVINEDGHPWIVMEFVEAPTLTDIVGEHGPLGVGQTAAVGLALLDALQAAHQQGIVHRDVKPGNVMVSDSGRVKLADFGVAAVQGDPKITATGLIVGSPSYMAPEQAREGRSTAATDLWGLGATLFFAIEGRPPFDRGGAIPTLTAVTHEPPAPMDHAGPLAPLIERLLRKDPEERPAPDEVASQLRAFGDSRPPAPAPVAATTAVLTREQPPVAEDDPWTVPAAAPRRRNVWPALLAVAVLLLGAAWLASGALRDDGGEQPVAAPTQDQTARGPEAERPTARPTTDEEEPAGQEQPADEEQPAGDDQQGDEQPDDEEPPTEAAQPAGDGPEIPEGWEVHDIADTGSTVAYPADWEPQPRDSATTDLVDPEGGRYLRVQYTDDPKDDAVADWQQQSESFGARHDNYEEVRIEPVDMGDDAALWEYTYSAGGADLHAYNLAIVTGGRAYALNFQTHESRWEESQDIWEQIVDSFDPSSG